MQKYIFFLNSNDKCESKKVLTVEWSIPIPKAFEDGTSKLEVE